MAIISLLVSLAQLAMDIIELLVRLNSSKPLLYKTKGLHGGGRRMSARAVKAAGLALIGAQRRALTEEAFG